MIQQLPQLPLHQVARMAHCFGQARMWTTDLFPAVADCVRHRLAAHPREPPRLTHPASPALLAAALASAGHYEEALWDALARWALQHVEALSGPMLVELGVALGRMRHQDDLLLQLLVRRACHTSMDSSVAPLLMSSLAIFDGWDSGSLSRLCMLQLGRQQQQQRQPSALNAQDTWAASKLLRGLALQGQLSLQLVGLLRQQLEVAVEVTPRTLLGASASPRLDSCRHTNCQALAYMQVALEGAGVAGGADPHLRLQGRLLDECMEVWWQAGAAASPPGAVWGLVGQAKMMRHGTPRSASVAAPTAKCWRACHVARVAPGLVQGLSTLLLDLGLEPVVAPLSAGDWYAAEVVVVAPGGARWLISVEPDHLFSANRPQRPLRTLLLKHAWLRQRHGCVGSMWVQEYDWRLQLGWVAVDAPPGLSSPPSLPARARSYLAHLLREAGVPLRPAPHTKP